MDEKCITAGFLVPKNAERSALEIEAGKIVPSLTSIEKGISIALSYVDPSEQEQAEELVRELLLKIPGSENYDLVINSSSGSKGVGPEANNTSIT